LLYPSVREDWRTYFVPQHILIAGALWAFSRVPYFPGPQRFAALPIPAGTLLNLGEGSDIGIVFAVVAADIEVVDMLDTHLVLLGGA
jgi:hypothetical protein